MEEALVVELVGLQVEGGLVVELVGLQVEETLVVVLAGLQVEEVLVEVLVGLQVEEALVEVLVGLLVAEEEGLAAGQGSPRPPLVLQGRLPSAYPSTDHLSSQLHDISVSL